MSIPTPPAGSIPPAQPPSAPQAQPNQFQPAQPGYPNPPNAYPTTPAAGASIEPPTKRSKTLAVVALVLAIGGAVMACIPFIAWFAGPVLIAAIIVAIVAMAKKDHGGTGLSVASLVIAIIGGAVSIVMGFVSIGLAGQAAIDESVREEVATADEPGAEADAQTETASERESTTTTDVREELVLVETAFGRTSYDDTSWWYVAIFENPNEDHVFPRASISIEALDADGTILDTSNDYRTILSGRTAVSGRFISVGQSEVASIEVRGPQASSATRSPKGETGAFEITAIAPTTTRYSTEVHGKVTSSFADDQEFVEVVVVARNPEGTIIGADWSYVDRLPAGGTAQFEARFSDPLPDGTTYEAYAVL